MIMSIFMAQIQAHSNHMWGGISSVLNTGSIMILPLIWPLLLSGVHGQCVTGGDIWGPITQSYLINYLGSLCFIYRQFSTSGGGDISTRGGGLPIYNI